MSQFLWVGLLFLVVIGARVVLEIEWYRVRRARRAAHEAEPAARGLGAIGPWMVAAAIGLVLAVLAFVLAAFTQH
jgi:hypothetical protein